MARERLCQIHMQAADGQVMHACTFKK